MPNENKAQNQIGAGFLSAPCPWCTMNINVDWISNELKGNAGHGQWETNWFDKFGQWFKRIDIALISAVIALMIVGLCCMSIFRGCIMKTVSGNQMLVRYEAPLVLYQLQNPTDQDSAPENPVWRPVLPTAEGLTL